MSDVASGGSRRAYLGTLLLLAMALAFPIGLMVLNPTLMFERGWEQYLGTAIYLWAAITLSFELLRLWHNERSFKDAPTLLKAWTQAVESPTKGPVKVADEGDQRVLPSRLRQLASSIPGGRAPSIPQLMELNREASSLDQEQAAGRFTLTRYILYLLPVIGFIGTVEGISKALMNISKVLPMVKDLDGFMNNLTGVTSALQIAFDSTLLALFLSAALMLVQTLVFRRSEDLLARIDRWVVEHLLPHFGSDAIHGD
ncbi:MAG TPA: MotA/TolQ/ExbB proton channel family protein, partial [Isosphaeraceae bacterium]|nr:MotA/TolQ/ExbB proton channel family protein [Isosphaeraceae bacterium]